MKISTLIASISVAALMAGAAIAQQKTPPNGVLGTGLSTTAVVTGAAAVAAVAVTTKKKETATNATTSTR
jgi:hypothetical protein